MCTGRCGIQVGNQERRSNGDKKTVTDKEEYDGRWEKGFQEANGQGDFHRCPKGKGHLAVLRSGGDFRCLCG